MASRLPFADSEGNDDFETDAEDDYDPQLDSSDEEGLEDFDEDFDSMDKTLSKRISKAISQSLEDGIIPKRQYLKALSQDQYNKVIGKDAYAFLHGHEDEVIEVLAVGKEVSEYFKTISAIDVREVYWIIITNLEKMGWSSRDMVEELMNKFPTLEKYQAERIIQTETTRVINYCKEYIAERGDLGQYFYGWVGPLDNRTTPMCYYMQTGQLRPSDIKALEKAGHTAEELPKIPEQGLPLEALKECCRIVANCFGYDMISDWVMHINCRHTFARGNKRLDVEFAEPSDVERVVDELQGLLPERDDMTVTTIPTYEDEETGETIDLAPVIEEDKASFPMFDGFGSYVFMNSIYDMPVIYNDVYTDDIFVFEQMNEEDVASWARMVLQLRDEGLEDTTIIWAIEDMGNIEDDTIAYIVTHADEIMERADAEGWL